MIRTGHGHKKGKRTDDEAGRSDEKDARRVDNVACLYQVGMHFLLTCASFQEVLLTSDIGDVIPRCIGLSFSAMIKAALSIFAVKGIPFPNNTWARMPCTSRMLLGLTTLAGAVCTDAAQLRNSPSLLTPRRTFLDPVDLADSSCGTKQTTLEAQSTHE